MEDDGDPSAGHDNASFYVQVGDVVTLKEINDPDNNSFAMVKAIITHRVNNGRVYAFFILTWVEDLKNSSNT